MDALTARIEALRPDQWLAEFPVEPLTAQERSALVADLDMLAAAVVSSTLLPYYALGADALATQAGARAAQVAEAVAARVTIAMASSRLLKSVLDTFIQKPVETEGVFLAGLRDLLDRDDELALDLARLLTAEPQAEEATLQAMVKVTQNIRTVQGSVVGVIVGADVLNRIAGLSGGSAVADVHQTVEAVESGGEVVGAVVGSEKGVIHVGGQQQYGDVVNGGKTQVNTGGGAYVGGDVHTGGGGFVGRDKHVGGDEVHGGKIEGGQVNLGGGASEVRFGNVTIIQGGPHPGSEDSPGPLIEETIRLDVAAPSVALLDEPFDVAVAVRQPEAPALALESLTGVTSGEGSIFRSEEDEVVRYRIELTGTGCEVTPSHYVLKLRPRTNSRPCIFQVTVHRPGKRVLLVSAYQEDEALAAQTRVQIEIEVPVEPRQ